MVTTAGRGVIVAMQLNSNIHKLVKIMMNHAMDGAGGWYLVITRSHIHSMKSSSPPIAKAPLV